jgi:oligoribonuclease
MFRRAFNTLTGRNASNGVKVAAKTAKVTKSKPAQAKINKVSKAGKSLSASEIIKQAHENEKKLHKYDSKLPIVWIDCEMTGLDHKNDVIIEICCLITDKDLKLIDEEGYESVIHQDQIRMDQMDEWCTQHHGSSGLTEKVVKSTKTMGQVEEELLEYLRKYMNKGVGILAGNSVHMDRLFMLKDMPRVVDYLTYRIIDVSSVMEIAKRFNPAVLAGQPRKQTAHTARADIIESIAQLAYFQQAFLKAPTPVVPAPSTPTPTPTLTRKT